tara:strand:+ start:395 stop:577 length:183 start_codon:yes stop_codon:yes gene_type:complete
MIKISLLPLVDNQLLPLANTVNQVEISNSMVEAKDKISQTNNNLSSTTVDQETLTVKSNE